MKLKFLLGTMCLMLLLLVGCQKDDDNLLQSQQHTHTQKH